MNLDPITTALQAIEVDSSPLFNRVTHAVDPATVIENGVINTDVAFVVPLGEVATSDERTTGTFSQELTITFAVMIGVRAVNDRLGSDINARLNTIKTEMRKALLGMEIGPQYDEIEFAQGELVEFYKGGAFWMDQYTTNYLYEQE